MHHLKKARPIFKTFIEQIELCYASPALQNMKWKCTVCEYVYDEDKGDPDSGVNPGTKFEDLPEGWICPVCGATKDMFEKAD